jgi:hypothetical protein
VVHGSESVSLAAANIQDETTLVRIEREFKEKELEQHLQTYAFRTYRPAEFRKLRELFKIDEFGEDGA